MVTGYEVHMYAHIERIAKALERIANAMEQAEERAVQAERKRLANEELERRLRGRG